MADEFGEVKIYDDATNKNLRIRLIPHTADVWVGGKGRGGDLYLFDDSGAAAVWLNGGGTDSLEFTNTARIEIQASDGSIRAGGRGVAGRLYLESANNKPIVLLDGNKSVISLRTSSDGGFFDGTEMIRVDAQFIPGGAQHSSIRLWGFIPTADLGNPDIVETIHIDGMAGDITLANADCAEEFDVSTDDAEPGTVMVIGDDGALRPSMAAYDRTVAGVVSGAGDYRPGITLGKTASPGKRVPVALAGRVFCRADAQESAVAIGDLLTTSTIRGHAMRATDRNRAFGAVIGKALRPLASGTGLIPILVALQ